MIKWPFVTRKKYDTDMLAKECELFVQMGEVFDLTMQNDDLMRELDACWKCINKRSNKKHWMKQKRVNGKWAK